MARRPRRSEREDRRRPAAEAVGSARRAVALAVPGATGARLAAVTVAAGALVLYVATLAPTVTLVDSGELILAAAGLGVAHPPGFPLWVLLGHAVTHLPWASLAERVHLLSALGAAMACALLVLASRPLLALVAAMPPTAPGSRPEPGEPIADGGTSRLDAWLAAALAGLLLAVARSHWSYATLAEVYAVNTALVATMVFLALRVVTARGTAVGAWLALALVSGVALGVHHVSIALTGLALVPLLWSRRAELLRRDRWWLPAAGLASCAAVYAYLPWAASRDPPLAWGAPTTLQAFWWHLSGRQYRSYFDVSVDSVVAQGKWALSALVGQLGPRWLPLAVLVAGFGVLVARRRSAPLAGTLVLLLALPLAFAATYPIAEDGDAYLLPAVVGLVLATCLGAAEILARLRVSARWQHRLGRVLLAGLPLVALVANWQPCDRAAMTVAADYTADVLAPVAPDGLLLTSDWQVYAPLLYLRDLEGRRADVGMVDISLLRRSWYFERLPRDAPGIAAAVGEASTAFLEELRRWEHDPGLYERDRVRNRAINDRFQALVVAMVEAQLAGGRRVYVTEDVVIAQGSPDPSLAALLVGRFAIEPKGLVFELTRALPPVVEPAPVLAARVFTAVGATAYDQVVSQKVRPRYLTMAVNRALYLAARGDRRGALSVLDVVLGWAPGYASAEAQRRRLLASSPS